MKLHARHAALGASLGELAGAEVVRRYGDDPADEYRAVREAAGIVERSDLGAGRMWGRDPVRMLNGLITNDLAGAGRTTAVYAAMLTPKGRVITDLRAWARTAGGGVEVWFSHPRDATEALGEHLRKYIPPLFARWELLEGVTTIGIYGPRSAALVADLVGATPPAAEDGVVEGTVGGEPVSVLMTRIAGGEAGYDLLVADGLLPELWDRAVARGEKLGARPVGMAALETLRVEAGRPRFGRELTEETIPAEAYETTGLLPRAVSFTKGCYTGQEVVVRIAHRGHVNRHLRGIALGDAPTPPDGGVLVRAGDGKEVGRVTSAAHSPLLKQTIALAYLRREVSPGDLVRVGDEHGPSGIVVQLPFEPTT